MDDIFYGKTVFLELRVTWRMASVVLFCHELNLILDKKEKWLILRLKRTTNLTFDITLNS